MAKYEDSRVRTVIKVGGSVHGQIAVGNRINQNLERPDEGRLITDTDWADLRTLLDGLRTRVAAGAPSEQQAAALERVDELTDALTADEPEIGIVRYVLGWFRKKVPILVDAVQDVVLTPLVSRIVGAAGDVAAGDFEQILRDLHGI